MANTIFSRSDRGTKCREHEIFILSQMITGKKVDIAYFLAEQLVKIGKAQKGDIGIGGLVTTILKGVGHNLSRLEPDLLASRVDFEHCRHANMFRMIGSSIHFCYGKPLFRLPHHERTSISNEANWLPRDDTSDAAIPASTNEQPISDTFAFEQVDDQMPNTDADDLLGGDDEDADREREPSPTPPSDRTYWEARFDTLAAQVSSLDQRVHDDIQRRRQFEDSVLQNLENIQQRLQQLHLPPGQFPPPQWFLISLCEFLFPPSLSSAVPYITFNEDIE